jgi:hypothetical protein
MAMVHMLLLHESMKLRNLLLVPELGLAVAYRTTREWRLGGSSRHDGGGWSASFGRLVGLAAGAALGAGLTLLLEPEARAAARRVVKDVLPERSTASRPNRCADAPAEPTRRRAVRGNVRESEDADACDVC